MNIEIKTPEKLIELLNWSLEDAPILNKDLSSKLEEFHSSIESNLTVTSAGELSDNAEDLKDVITMKIANYIFDKYDAVFVTPNERLIGVLGENSFELYDGTGKKLYLDGRML